MPDGRIVTLFNEASGELWDHIKSGEPFEAMKVGEITSPGRSINKVELVAENRMNTEDVVLLVSDMHIGARNDKINKDSWEGIFKTLQKNVMKLLGRVEVSVEVSAVNIFLLGDIVTGETKFPGQAFEIDMTVNEQINVFVHNMKALLEALFVGLGVPIRVFCVAGNHGTVSRFGAKETNWDRTAYEMLKWAVKDTEDIEVYAAKGFFQMVTIRGHTYLLVHGDSINMYQNIPLYGCIQASMRWAGSLGHHDVLCLGHFHQSTQMQWNDTTILINGTTYVGDEFSLDKLKLKPGALFWMFGASDKRPITWQYRVDVDGTEI
jgi:predicted phosphodiesterase